MIITDAAGTIRFANSQVSALFAPGTWDTEWTTQGCLQRPLHHQVQTSGSIRAITYWSEPPRMAAFQPTG
jgi:hypothetical protein